MNDCHANREFGNAWEGMASVRNTGQKETNVKRKVTKPMAWKQVRQAFPCATLNFTLKAL